MRSLPPYGRPKGPRFGRGTTAVLVLAVCCATLTAMLPVGAALVALSFAVTALAVASVLSARVQWLAMQAEDAPARPAADAEAVAAAALTDRLRRLREEHVAEVDAALDNGRPDLARELSDAYTDSALRMITDGAGDTAVTGPRA